MALRPAAKKGNKVCRRRKSPKWQRFCLPVQRVLKDLDPLMGVTPTTYALQKSVKLGLGYCANSFCHQLALKANDFKSGAKRQIMAQQDVLSAVKLMLPASLAKEAVPSIENHIQVGAPKPRSRYGAVKKSVPAPAPVFKKLHVKPSMLKSQILKDLVGKHRKPAGIAMASAIQFLITRVLNAARKELPVKVDKKGNAKRCTITMRGVFLGVQHDADLRSFFHNVHFFGAGVLPEVVVAQKKAKKRQPSRRGGVPGGVKKPHRFKPGTSRLRLIRKLQKQVGPKSIMLPNKPFERLTKEIAQDYKIDLRFDKLAVASLRSGAENHLISLLRTANANAAMANRAGVYPKDMHLAREQSKKFAPSKLFAYL